MKKKTHQVLDTIYHEDEGQGVFVGTLEECHEFISEQGGYGYVVAELSRVEYEFYNNPLNA